MDYPLDFFRYFPRQAIAGGWVPIIQFTAGRLVTRQLVQKKRQLREKVIALNAFIASMNDVPDEGEHHAACLQDALRQRRLVSYFARTIPR